MGTGTSSLTLAIISDRVSEVEVGGRRGEDRVGGGLEVWWLMRHERWKKIGYHVFFLLPPCVRCLYHTFVIRSTTMTLMTAMSIGVARGVSHPPAWPHASLSSEMAGPVSVSLVSGGGVPASFYSSFANRRLDQKSKSQIKK